MAAVALFIIFFVHLWDVRRRKLRSGRNWKEQLFGPDSMLFGLNDLKLAVEMVRALDLPFAVVINRADVGDGLTKRYCEQQRIDVLTEIPDDRRIAEMTSEGHPLTEAFPQYRVAFQGLWQRIVEQTGTVWPIPQIPQARKT